MAIQDLGAMLSYFSRLSKGTDLHRRHQPPLTCHNSRRFCGVARMVSAVDWENTDDDWLPREDGEEYEG
jgi:hypothetical protein